MRKITSSEYQLINYLLQQSGKKIDIPKIVFPMKDGGMRSISFDISEKQKRNSQIAKGTFNDVDGVLVDFELTIDDNGDLFELDFWKVDFSNLISLPELETIVIIGPDKS